MTRNQVAADLRRCCDALQRERDDFAAAAAEAQAERDAAREERDALREALRWNAASLSSAAGSLELVFEDDRITLGEETKTVAQILDAADAALAQHPGISHD